MRGSGNLLATRFNYGLRVIPHGVIDRAKWRNTLMYRLSQDLQVGIEYNPLADDVGPLVNWRLLRETATRPAVSVGTSSDRIGTPYGRAYFVTISKDLERETGLPIAPYFSVLYGSFDDELVYPFGMVIRLGDQWSVTPTFDGHAFHQLVTYSWDRYSVSGLLIRGRYPGIAVNVGF
ncbi:MAG: hypothetical protein ACK47B_09705 [Armatimonadota bacterium]